MDLEIAADDARRDDVRTLLETYTDHAGSVCMTIELGRVDGADR